MRMTLAVALTQMADIWSTGVILYAILFGRYPFYAQEQEKIPRRIVDAAFAIPPDIPVSASCVNLVTRILVADPRWLPMHCTCRTLELASAKF